MIKIVLFGVLIYLVAVNARHFRERNENEELDNEEETLRRPKEHSYDMNRHRRRRWQPYGYDYPPPMYPYPDRRDYDRNNQEVLLNIYKLLEEISTNIRRPPQPALPVYIPYPVPYPYPQFPKATAVPCTPTNQSRKDPVPEGRIKEVMEDTNQNWGLVVSNENDYDDGSDGARPISFEPIVPKQFMQRPSPKVEHGSVQESRTNEAKLVSAESAPSPSAPFPGMCNAAKLSCCGMSNDQLQQKQCFMNVGCDYENDACTSANIQRALDSFKSAYSPLNS